MLLLEDFNIVVGLLWATANIKGLKITNSIRTGEDDSLLVELLNWQWDLVKKRIYVWKNSARCVLE